MKRAQYRSAALPRPAPASKTKHPEPALTVDCVLFDKDDRILLIRRKHEPFTDRWALPGGFVDAGETVEAAALRELKEETGLIGSKPELIGIYSDPKRDPRQHNISAAYIIHAYKGALAAGDDAAGAEFVAVTPRTPLAFDHRQIIKDAIAKRG